MNDEWLAEMRMEFAITDPKAQVDLDLERRLLAMALMPDILPKIPDDTDQ